MSSVRSQTLLTPRAMALVLLGALVAALLILSPSAEARRPGRISFAGLQSATTCIGGPIGPGRTSSYHLAWQAASERNPRARIVYEIYQATAPGGENFSEPTYTTARGATSFETPELPTVQSFYFVVRALDRGGHEDSNTLEREGQNLCL